MTKNTCLAHGGHLLYCDFPDTVNRESHHRAASAESACMTRILIESTSETAEIAGRTYIADHHCIHTPIERPIAALL